jgi:hypothetical protein
MAMRDVYEDRRKSLRERIESFPKVPGQKGLLVLVDGKAVGLDYVSREETYGDLHEKLIRSYTLEPSLEKERRQTDPQEAHREAKRFLEDATRCKGTAHESIGYGRDHRLKGEHQTGSALVHQDEVVHCAIFQHGDDEEGPGRGPIFRRFSGLGD